MRRELSDLLPVAVGTWSTLGGSVLLQPLTVAGEPSMRSSFTLNPLLVLALATIASGCQPSSTPQDDDDATADPLSIPENTFCYTVPGLSEAAWDLYSGDPERDPGERFCIPPEEMEPRRTVGNGNVRFWMRGWVEAINHGEYWDEPPQMYPGEIDAFIPEGATLPRLANLTEAELPIPGGCHQFRDNCALNVWKQLNAGVTDISAMELTVHEFTPDRVIATFAVPTAPIPPFPVVCDSETNCQEGFEVSFQPIEPLPVFGELHLVF